MANRVSAPRDVTRKQHTHTNKGGNKKQNTQLCIYVILKDDEEEEEYSSNCICKDKFAFQTSTSYRGDETHYESNRQMNKSRNGVSRKSKEHFRYRASSKQRRKMSLEIKTKTTPPPQIQALDITRR